MFRFCNHTNLLVGNFTRLKVFVFCFYKYLKKLFYISLIKNYCIINKKTYLLMAAGYQSQVIIIIVKGKQT
jgi:hypothetical protein